ncbi:acyltransferase [Zhengella mangrovi]|uniref:Acyltransferase n=1 Tax=Zhengella mangrovi TaxID=1982044 RepID=A0A2G1QJY8_9HYPH|nr:acyltransferase [Zhengella mangrovi]PHP65845.1 acyltransferase [Zhengella mangrovi]
MAARDETGRGASERMASLDLLRLFSAVAVAGYHYLFRGSAGTPAYLDHGVSTAAPVAIFGYLGLNLFFMISGFVIAWSAEGRSFTGFVIARFSRLYPGFLACMTITFVVLLLAGDPRLPAGAGQYGANLAMLAPAFGQPFMDGVYWTIILEMVFYFWVSLAILSGLFSSRRLLLVAAWLVIAMINERWLQSGAVRLALITEYAPFFAGGILAYHLVAHRRGGDVLMLMAAAFLMALSHMAGMQAWMLEHYGTALTSRELVLAGIALHLVFWATVMARRFVSPTPLVLMLGGLTYPLYLLHQNIGYVTINALAPSIGEAGALSAASVMVLLLSWSVWRFIEAPGRRWLAGRLHAMASYAWRFLPAGRTTAAS